MRPEPNNDIDLLLRQLSRRNGSPVSEIEAQHLDADELNSYVANALPATARTRYTEHLADCSSCRKLVAQLSAAQGPVPVQQSASVVASWSLKSFFASLFSPMVLRYAVPAVGLIVIAVVGIVVFRQNERGGSVASVTEAQRRVVVNQPQAAESPSPGYHYDSTTVAKNDSARAEKDATRGEAGPVAPVTKDAPSLAKPAAEATTTTASEPPPAPAKAAPVEAEEDKPEDADKLKLKKDAPAEKQAAAREPMRDRDEANKNPAKEETTIVTQGATARKDIAVRSAKSAEVNASRGSDLKRAPGTSTGTAGAGAQADSRSRQQSNEQAKPTGTFASGETRSVAGRRFQKRGGAWVDSGYDSSKPVTNVARGSEQYRALIGDEPSIREIADQLDGEIIVVWKGHTYRIR